MAGGFGTRLRPLTINLPKPMTPVGNLPIMEHVVSLLAEHGITDITALLYFQPETIRNHFGDGSAFGVSIKYCLPDDDYGTAGAVRYALREGDDTVLVISGDLITDFNLNEALTWHREKRSEATILLTRTENPLQYGIVITSPDGRIVRFLEKPSWGEAFSDTINTGVYILEKASLDLIPPLTNFDFSQNLFPLMLSRQMSLFGKIMDGYWKDVGNVSEYQRVHADLLSGKLRLNLKADPTTTEEGTVYKGANVHLEDNVHLSGRVILGNDVRLESGAKLLDCVIGPRTRIGRGARITNSVLWSDNLVGDECEIDGSIVCRRSTLGPEVKLNDNVIISDDCEIGAAAMVKANCKVWPGKTVDPGAIVSTSIVWGDKWNRELFTDSKTTGLALTEVSPDMVVRLGTALGATLGPGASVVTSRDASDISRLLRRGLLSGILSAGVNVADLETTPVPVVRYELSRGQYAAGIYVRHNPADFRLIDIILFDGTGLDMPNAKLKKIERNYFGEDYELASMDEIGHLERPQRVLTNYRQDFMSAINADLIKQAGFKVVVDHSNGASSEIFPNLFSRLGVATTDLNAYLDPRKFSTSVEEQSQAIVRLSAIVRSLNADIGFLLNAAAEKLTVVDDDGRPVGNQLLLLVVLELFLQTNRAASIAVPVAASMGVEELAEQYGVQVTRVANDHRAMMEARRAGKVNFVGGTRGGFIFPGFQMGADAMLAAVKILEMMAQTRTRFSELRAKHEIFHRQATSVPCPWSKRGQVMRRLITETDTTERQLIDGVRIFDEGGWVLIAPDRLKASFDILVESRSSERTDLLLDRYRKFVETCRDD
jgi:mannose-1-phosphate guanylyltransferase/phosphomannomutase